MLRPVTLLVRSLRRRAPSARERLAYRMLQALVVEPEPRAVRVAAKRSASRHGDSLSYNPYLRYSSRR